MDLIIGSLISSISLTVGNSAGELIVASSPFVFRISYATLGAVVIKSRSVSYTHLTLPTKRIV